MNELSKLTGISVRTIQRHEKGENIERECLCLYRNVFQLSMEFILGEKKNLFEKYDKEGEMISCEEIFQQRFAIYNYEVMDCEKYYYVLYMREGPIGKRDRGAWTTWGSYIGTNKEKRVPRLIEGVERKKIEDRFGRVMIVNSEKDIQVFILYGGIAVVEKSLGEKYFPSMFKLGFVVERKNYHMENVK